MGVCCGKQNGILDTLKPDLPKEHEETNEIPEMSRIFPFVQRKNIQKHYTLQQIIGSGFFGSVRVAVRSDGTTGEKFAVKSIAKERLVKKTLLRQELETIHNVDHPNIVKVYEVFEDDRFIHLVMELCSGGELFERVTKLHRLAEAEAAALLNKVLLAVNHMHNLKICHRDIKAENILFSQPSPTSEIKLIDFGLSQKFGEDSTMHSIVGTPYYVAPEVLRKEYGPECDVWSIGVLLYFMLTGYPPFEGESTQEIYLKILSYEVSFDDFMWETISADAKDLLTKLLARSNRITAAEALRHPWFAAHLEKGCEKTQSKILRRLSRAHSDSRLRTDVLSVISRHLNTEELAHINRLFRSIDTGFTGYISYEELQAAFESLSRSQVDNVLEVFESISKQGKIKYSEFITAAMDRRILYDKEIRWMTFKFFDPEDKGYITIPDMVAALRRLDSRTTEEETLLLIQESGLKYDRWIDFHEFCKILEPLPDELSSVSGSSSAGDIDAFNKSSL